MGKPKSTGLPPSKDGRPWRPPGKGPHDDREVRLAYGLVHLPAVAHFLDGVELQEMRLTLVEEGYRVMLKGKRGNQPKVAFLYANSWKDALILVATTLDSGHSVWWDDKYPPRG